MTPISISDISSQFGNADAVEIVIFVVTFMKLCVSKVKLGPACCGFAQQILSQSCLVSPGNLIMVRWRQLLRLQKKCRFTLSRLQICLLSDCLSIINWVTRTSTCILPRFFLIIGPIYIYISTPITTPNVQN